MIKSIHYRGIRSRSRLRRLAVTNESTLLAETPPADLQNIFDAINQQMAQAAQCWERNRWHVHLLAPGVRPGRHDVLIALLDDADQANALGYHDVTPDDKPYGRVFVRPILESGGDLSSSSNSVSVTLSHEALELWGDAACNLWADVRAYEYAVELCDAVEGDAYVIESVMVSNFLLPAYFDEQAPMPYDYMARLSGCAPTMTAGGYVIRRKQGQVSAVYGEQYQDRRDRAHPAARTFRRGVL